MRRLLVAFMIVLVLLCACGSVEKDIEVNNKPVAEFSLSCNNAVLKVGESKRIEDIISK